MECECAVNWAIENALSRIWNKWKCNKSHVWKPFFFFVSKIYWFDTFHPQHSSARMIAITFDIWATKTNKFFWCLAATSGRTIVRDSCYRAQEFGRNVVGWFEDLSVVRAGFAAASATALIQYSIYNILVTHKCVESPSSMLSSMFSAAFLTQAHRYPSTHSTIPIMCSGAIFSGPRASVTPI